MDKQTFSSIAEQIKQLDTTFTSDESKAYQKYLQQIKDGVSVVVANLSILEEYDEITPEQQQQKQVLDSAFKKIQNAEWLSWLNEILSEKVVEAKSNTTTTDIYDSMTSNDLEKYIGLEEEVKPHHIYNVSCGWFAEIPSNIKSTFSNVILDKGTTGCGATTYYIQNNENVVIAVPRSYLIHSKCSQHLDVFGVCTDDNGLCNVSGSEEKLITYLRQRKEQNKPIKVMCTYDSIAKVNNAFLLANADIQKAKLMIDEYQFLLLDHFFKRDAHIDLYNFMSKHSDVILVSATPIKGRYLFDELKRFEVVQLNWLNAKTIPLEVLNVTRIPHELSGRIQNKLIGKTIPNLYIFCNSVKMIKALIDKNKLNNNLVKVVCANTAENIQTLTKKHPIRQLDDRRSDGSYYPINFITSTSFAGVDCYDTDGQTIIVSDAAYVGTFVDIQLEVIQIIGRLRNCDYTRYTPIHIIAKGAANRYDGLTTYEDQLKAVCRKIDYDKEYVSEINSLKNPNMIISTLKENVRVSKYVEFFTEESKQLVFNERMAKCDMYLYDLRRNIISIARYEKETEGTCLDMSISNNRTDASTLLAMNESARIPFDVVWNEYVELMKKKDDDTLTPADEERVEVLESQRDFISDAYKLLTDAEVKAAKYHVGSIKRMILARSNGSNEAKIIKAVRSKYRAGEIVPVSKVKAFMTTLYNDLGIERKVKGTTIQDFCRCEIKGKYIDGKKTKSVFFIAL